MNKYVVAMVLMSVVRVMCQPMNAAAQAGQRGTNAVADLSIGERVWPPVETGLVFIDGEYIPPPYVVSRREGEIFLNGRHLDWVTRWPPPKEVPPASAPETEPVMPTSITEKTTKYDKDYVRYISHMRAYLLAKYGQEKGIEMMVDVYRGIPCVLTAEQDKDDRTMINLKWKSGDESHINEVPFTRKRDNITKEQAVKWIDDMTEIYVRALGNNNYFMLGATVGRRGTQETFERTLVPLATNLKIAKDEADFLSIMKTNQPVGGMSEAAFRAFYKHKDGLPKWEPRIRNELKGK